MALAEKRTYRNRNSDRSRRAAALPQALPLPDNHVQQLFTFQQNLQPTAGSDGGKAVLSEIARTLHPLPERTCN